MTSSIVRSSPDRPLDEYDLNPFLLLQHFRLPDRIEHSGDVYDAPRLLQSGAIEVLSADGILVIFSANQITVGGRPLLDLAREALMIRTGLKTAIS
ncbi:MAG: hypothetical protein ACYC7A_21920 [Thermoanaerobaculia bacterium]